MYTSMYFLAGELNRDGVTLPLHDEQAHQRLHAGHVGTAGSKFVLVVQGYSA